MNKLLLNQISNTSKEIEDIKQTISKVIKGKTNSDCDECFSDEETSGSD